MGSKSSLSYSRYTNTNNISVRIVRSVMWFWTMYWQQKRTPFWIWAYTGSGLPRQRLHKAQAPFLVKEAWCEFWAIKLHRLSIVPKWISMSLLIWLSPARFPIAQMACSTMARMGLLRQLTKIWMPPLSTTVWVCWVVPEATLVNAHNASNLIWGYWFWAA